MRRLRKLSTLAFIIVAIASLVAIPVSAQIERPDSTFVVNQIEVYRNCLESQDQLWLITTTQDYTINPTNYDAGEAFIIQIVNQNTGAIEGNTTIYPYYQDGYVYSTSSVYFSAADALTWTGNYSVRMIGNPTLHWLNTSANHSMAAAFLYDGGTYVDFTSEANSGVANSVNLTAPVPAAGDAFYFGSAGMFNTLTVNIGTQGAWTGTYTWEYWDGDSWEVPDGLNDASNGFTAGTGDYDITYTCPTNWQKTTVNGVNDYYLRFRIVSYSAVVTQPLGTQIWTNTMDSPPEVTNTSIALWYDESTLQKTSTRVTTRIRALAQVTEDSWGGTTDLISTIAGEQKLTDTGAEYFENVIDNLRTIAPDLFVDVVETPDFAGELLIQDNLTGGDDADTQIFGVNWAAQTFTASDYYSITGADLKLYRVGNPGAVTVSIRETAAGLPNGADVVSGTRSGNDFVTDTDGEWEIVTFTDDYALTSNTTYAIVVRATVGDANNYIMWRTDTNNGLAGGQSCTSINSGVAWAAVPANDSMFQSLALQDFNLTYRNRLANQLIGTPIDVSDLANDLNIDRMWLNTLIWLAFSLVIAVAASKILKSGKLTTIIMFFLLPFGALLGFIYLEVAMVAAFLCGVLVIYVISWNRSAT